MEPGYAALSCVMTVAAMMILVTVLFCGCALPPEDKK